MVPDESIKLNEEVNKIKWHENEPVIVSCKSGETYSVDHVIITISLAYLQRHHKTLFSPSLPSWKSEVLERMAMGKVNKIFLHFETPFWTPGDGSVKLAWDDLENSSNQHNTSNWYRAIFAFDEVLNNPNVLGAWLSGDSAEYMETLSDDEVIETCIKLLRQFLANPRLPAPIRVVRSKWCTNPYTLGSYSYVGKDTSSNDIETLAKPVLCNAKSTAKLLFAGEATSLSAYSTMHGARDSGLREAQRLCKLYDGK